MATLWPHSGHSHAHVGLGRHSHRCSSERFRPPDQDRPELVTVRPWGMGAAFRASAVSRFAGSPRRRRSPRLRRVVRTSSPRAAPAGAADHPQSRACAEDALQNALSAGRGGQGHRAALRWSFAIHARRRDRSCSAGLLIACDVVKEQVLHQADPPRLPASSKRHRADVRRERRPVVGRPLASWWLDR